MKLLKYNLVIIVCFLFTSLGHGATIKVGAYDFPPFVLWQSGVPHGIVTEIVKELNSIQQNHKFQLVETSANRRYEDLQSKLYDVIFFESIKWGWENYPINASNIFLVGGEVFIAKKFPNSNQAYFNQLKNKTIRGILGYHYGFASFSTDPKFLKQWNLELTNSHEGNIMAVLEDRSNLAIVTKEYLDLFLKRNPAAKSQLLISKKMDQVYQHTVLVRKDALITVGELNSLLDKLKKNQFFKKVL